jgi:adenosylhomocysteine nucleosidase
MKIAIFSAFPHELKYIRGGLSCGKGVKRNSFTIFAGKYKSQEILVVQTGMGIQNATSAFEYVAGEYSPGLILSLGFGGALYRGARQGDLIWASSVSILEDEGLQTVDIPGAKQIAGRLMGTMEVHQGHVVTLADWVKKADVRKRFPGDHRYTVCDMETYPLARLSLEKGLPFFAARSVTDTEEEEIPEELLDTTDESGHYSLSRALRIILSHPGLIPDALKLWRASTIASRNLCALAKLLVEMAGVR